MHCLLPIELILPLQVLLKIVHYFSSLVSILAVLLVAPLTSQLSMLLVAYQS
jgi:hypothetical protein